MDRRQTEIVEGAGLEESRINADFADWLKRWGSPILLAILVLALGYRGWMWYQDKQVAELDNAFIELDAASQAGQPVALMQVADDWDGRATVSQQARLEAADRLMLAYSTGVKPGGMAGIIEDAASDEDLQGYLNQASRLYDEVEQESNSRTGQAILLMHAISGRAAVAASKGEFAQAISMLERVIELAEDQGMTGLANAMRDRIEMVQAEPVVAALPSQEAVVTNSRAMPAPAGDDEGFMTPDELLEEIDMSPADQGPPASPPDEGESETPSGG